ncbi:glycosyltransferase family 4 protein [Streptomyces daliensis]|uniref:D-inositol 3-phosphate glycosyltransferase n=1 Tax=Streptomyces daliensis TaxID=299421 RepID=A0A8T4J4J0_9ACTN|nr:glycosyltransferase family 4 protein [Streptomyces daliensis]
MKIVFLLHNVYAIGGTIRTTLNLATALADRGHEVAIASMTRHRDKPRFAIDPRITVVPLVDDRQGSSDTLDPLHGEPARDYPAADKRRRSYSRLSDVRARAYLGSCEADVIIGTRPGLNVYLARFGPRGALRIAQEHLRHDAHSKRLRRVLAREYRSLDALVTTTEADAEVYRTRMRLPGVRVLAVPNIVPEPAEGNLASATTPGGGPDGDGGDGGDGDGPKVVAAAGRLAPGKRFDLLIEAFATVREKHPDWTLRIYGGGRQKRALRDLTGRLGLEDSVSLMGPRSPIEKEFAKASLVASASDAESFGMTLVEAMRCGLPVVSTDCPLGPGEIIQDGMNGRLVPTGDADALASAMIELIENGERRRGMGTAARLSAHRFDPAPILRRYELLFSELHATRHQRARQRAMARLDERVRALVRRVRAALRRGPPVRPRRRTRGSRGSGAPVTG